MRAHLHNDTGELERPHHVQTDGSALSLAPEDLPQADPGSPLTEVPDSPQLVAVHGSPSCEHIDVVDCRGSTHRVNLPYIKAVNGTNLLHVECELVRKRLHEVPLVTDFNKPSGFVKIMHKFDAEAVAKAFAEGCPVVVKGGNLQVCVPEKDESLENFFWNRFSALPEQPLLIQSMARKAAMHKSLGKSGELYPPKDAAPVENSTGPQPELAKAMTLGEYCGSMSSNKNDITSCLEIRLHGQDGGIPALKNLNHSLIATMNLQRRDFGSLALHDTLWGILSEAQYVTLEHQDSEGLAIWTAIDWGKKIWSITKYYGPPEAMERNVGVAVSYLHDPNALKKLGFQVESVLLEATDLYIQPPGILHWVYTPEMSFNRGGSYFNFGALHLTEAARRVDVAYGHLTTNVDADDAGVYGSLAGMLAGLPLMYNTLAGSLYTRPMMALCLMLLDPQRYATTDVQLTEHPVYTTTIWRALRLTYYLGLDELRYVARRLSPQKQQRRRTKAIQLLTHALHPRNFKDQYDPGEKWQEASTYVETAKESENQQHHEIDNLDPESEEET